MAEFIVFIFSLTIALRAQLFPGEATLIIISNSCSYTVWPALSSPVSNNAPMFSLQERQSMYIELNSSWSGQLWGRTNCTDWIAGNFSCQTGDCESMDVNCFGYHAPAGTTVVELDLNGAYGEMYGVSLVHGYNVPIAVVPQGGSGSRCVVTGCTYYACPANLKLGGACQNPCDVFNSSVYCCDSAIRECEPFVYSTLFQRACPRAYSYGLEYGATGFVCGGSPDFVVIFCPSSDALINELSTPFQSPWPKVAPPSPSPSHAASPKRASAPAPALLMSQPRSSTTETKKRHLSIPVLVAVPTSTALMILLCFGIWISKKKKKSKARERAEIEDIRTMESLQFDINTIIAATSNFSPDNKLGEGGFGEVYKGKFENGQEVAVKRLLQNSKQGALEFKTEVVLVAKLQHKNLVKLLGFCTTPREKILVYEFLPNSSLDRFLLDQTSNAPLDWQTRFNIITGIARGLMYLHEDSRLTVIHRDLKTSNILLDGAMNPKISDFGLAKLFGEDQTHDHTKRIVGTYGYMAPEYAITGHYSVRSDVYSFGVIVLEIISGKKNRFFGGLQREEALLHRAWRLWSQSMSLDFVDTKLNHDFPMEEVTRCFHIGLLCIQEVAIRRPTMRSILDALNNRFTSLPDPNPPRCFGNPSDPEDHYSLPSFSGTQMITDLYSRD